MYIKINDLISQFSVNSIALERIIILHPLIEYIQIKKNNNEAILLNFICTHNSRRSHFSQVWAQTMSYHFNIKNVCCYSGGTEATAMFPKVVETLINQGFLIQKLSDNENPVYAIKYSENENPIICFSKIYNNEFNPKSNFAAVLTCSNADEGCPMVLGADGRFPITYNDPKQFDGTELMNEKYLERSLEIAQEMFYVFSNII
jgi:arsenate reductase (thioredoxin)